MLVTKEEYDTQLASDATALGFILTLHTGANPTTPVVQHFLVENNDPVTEIGRMNGYGLNLLLASGIITIEQAAEFRMAWRKIIKS